MTATTRAPNIRMGAAAFVLALVLAVAAGYFLAAAAGYFLGRDGGVKLHEVSVTEQVTFCNAGANICVAGSGHPYINRTGLNTGTRFPVAVGGHTTLTVGTFPGDGTLSVVRVGNAR